MSEIGAVPAQPTATAEAVHGAVEAPPAIVAGATAAPELPNLDELRRTYIAPWELAEKAQATVARAMEIAAAHNIQVEFTFDTNESLPEGFGLGVIPITKQAEKRGEKSKKVGVVIAQIPDPDYIAAMEANTDDDGQPILDESGAATTREVNEGGRKYIRITIISKELSRVAAARKMTDGVPSMPLTVADFIAGREAEDLAAWRVFADSFVKGLKKQGFKKMTQAILKQILTSAAMAAQLHPGIEQESWVSVLKTMIATAAGKGIEAGALQTWLDTRDSVTVIEPEDVDMDALATLIAAETADLEIDAA